MVTEISIIVVVTEISIIVVVTEIYIIVVVTEISIIVVVTEISIIVVVTEISVIFNKLNYLFKINCNIVTFMPKPSNLSLSFRFSHQAPRNISKHVSFFVCGEELLRPLSNPTLENHPLSTVSD